MQAEGLCPACGHLVIEAGGESEPAAAPTGPPQPGRNRKPGPQPQQSVPAGPVFVSAPGAKDGRLARSRDYTALLLGAAIYDCLLLPLLAVRVLFADFSLPLSVPVIAGICLPLSYLITRLLCTIDPETGRWIINNPLLRRVFTRLNAIWIDL